MSQSLHRIKVDAIAVLFLLIIKVLDVDWKYYIPHIWERERQVWEDIYLLPANNTGYDGDALWLTIDALGNINNPEHGSDRAEFQSDMLNKIGESDYIIDGAEMFVKVEDFSKLEFLEWVKVWLQEQNFPVSNLIEASTEEFRKKAFHADFIDAYEELQKDNSLEFGDR